MKNICLSILGDVSLCQQKQITMKTFKNINYKKRNQESTNIVFCQSVSAPNTNWIECDEIEIELLKCNHLYTQDGVRYFGYL